MKKLVDVLRSIDSNILQEILDPELSKKIISIVGNKENIDFAEIISSFFGERALENKLLRRDVIKSLGLKWMNEKSQKYLNEASNSAELNAMKLAELSWTSKNQFAEDLVNKLEISPKYLPSSLTRKNSLEYIPPIDKYFPLFPFQEEVKELILKNLHANKKRFIIQMPTGSGKTKTTLESILSYINEKPFFHEGNSILWVAHTEELCEQAINTIKTIWSHTQDDVLKIVRFWGSYSLSRKELKGTFIFTTYQKLSSKKNIDLLYYLKDFSKLVIVDEAHKVIAYTYHKSVSLLMEDTDNKLLGLTATPGRSTENTKENMLMASFFNHNLISINSSKNVIDYLRELQVLAKVKHKIIETGVNTNTDNLDFEINDFSTNQLKILARNVKRNRLIIEIIIEQIKNQKPSIVFSCTVEHSIILAGALNHYGIKSAFIHSNLKRSVRDKLIKDFNEGKYDVLLNYGILTTGFDSPRISSVIITRPTTSLVLYSQMLGRGLRGPKVGGGEFCEVIDIRDNFSDFGSLEDVYNYFDAYWS